MGQLRTTWQNTKKWSDDAASGKIPFPSSYPASNHAKTKQIMKTFSSGFGPALDKVEAAYKKKNDADTKKYADAALTLPARSAPHPATVALAPALSLSTRMPNCGAVSPRRTSWSRGPDTT
jgi:hypothetical protein